MKLLAYIKPKQILGLLILVVLTVFSLWLVINRAMLHPYNHDENQFVASAYLLGVKGLLPYRDFPYFHTPNQVLIYAPVLRYSINKLLSVRLLSALLGVGLVVLLYLSAYYLLSEKRFTTRLFLSLAAAVLLLANPLFAYTSGYAWNHDLATFFLFIAVLLHLVSAKKTKYLYWELGAGLFAALAAGTRSSYLIPAFAIIVSTFFLPQISRQDLGKRNLYLLAGGLFGLLPSIILFFLAPRKFLFGNLEYAMLNTQFRVETAFPRGMSLLGKFTFILERILSEPNNLLLCFTVLVLFFLPVWIEFWKTKKLEFETALFSFLILLNLVGSLLPTPAFYQYFYAPIPYLILASIYGIAKFQPFGTDHHLPGYFTGLFVLATFIAAMFGFQDVSKLTRVTMEDDWYPVHAHWYAEKIHNAVGNGKILTLEPLFAVEANKDIYPELAVSPFTFRISTLLTKSERDTFDIIGPDELNGIMLQNPPDAILVGNEDFDAPFTALAEKNNYSPQKISPELILWTPPQTP